MWFYNPPPGGGGDPGSGGAATSAGDIQKNYVAAVNLSAQRFVVTNSDGSVRYADPMMTMDAVRLLGLTVAAAMVGDSVSVLSYGDLEEPTWNWDLSKPIYLGPSGALTQTAPIVGTVLIVGVPLTPTRMFLNPKAPVVL